jgi:hypothetical protein
MANGTLTFVFSSKGRDENLTESPHPTLSSGVEREKEQNFLKTPLTFILSRKGRENLKEFI